MSLCCAWKLWTLPSWFTGYTTYCASCGTLLVKRNDEWRAN